MPTYAVLGGTGSTGSAIISQLLSDPSTHLNVLVRSRPRLLTAFPDLDKRSDVTIFTGDVSRDTDVLEECVRGVEVVFMMVGTNTNEKGIRVTQDVAEGLIKAFTKLRDETGPMTTTGESSGVRQRKEAKSYSAPTVIFLASASISPKLHRDIPKLFYSILYSAIYYVYRDLELAIEILRKEDWIPLVTICPGGLSKGTPVGSEISFDPPTTGLTAYGDLAEGIIQIGRDPAKYVGEEVVVQSRKPIKDGHAEVLLGNAIRGLIASWLPWLYQALKWVKLV